MTDLSAQGLPEAEDLADFFDNAAIGLHWVGPDGTILRANRAELELLGYRADEYVGRNIAEFHVDADVVADILRRLAAGETVREREARMRCKDGSVKTVLITSNVQWRAGQFVHTRCFTRDITERKRIEELQQQTVDYLEGLMEGFVAYDENWVMTYMNAAGERLLGKRRAQVLGRTWHEAFPHAVGNPVDLMYQRVMRSRLPERLEYHYPHYRRWFEISASPAKGGGVGVYFRDITDRKQAEKALRDSETRYRVVAGAANDLVWDQDLATNEVIAEEGALQLFGYGAGPMKLDGGWGERQVHPEDQARVKASLRAAIAGDAEFWQGEFRFRRADGTYADVSARAQIVRDERGWAVRFIGSLTDLTVRKRAEEALRRSERIYRAIGESIDYGIWICDPDGRNVYASESFLKLVGITQEQCSDFGWGQVLHPDDAQRTIAAWKECARTGAVWDIEHRFRGVDGEWHPILARGVPVKDESGRILCWAGINLDIGRLKSVEHALREADRRKDEFLATLAHELRNPLAPLRNGLHLLRLAAPGSDAAGQAQAMMERQVNHLVRLVDDLMEVSRITRGRVELRKEPVELSAVVLSAVEISRPAIEAARHKLDISLPAEPLTLEADFVRISQVLANLLNNAAKYTPDGGRIRLGVQREDGQAVISVRDTGVGMPRDMLDQVFEMFAQIQHTLPRAQGGLGIGLTLARSLVELHGGAIEARSDGPGQGSEFIVRLPVLAASRRAAPAGSKHAEHARKAGLRILVADDNEDAARSLALILRELGHEALLAYDGAAAVEIAQAQRPDVAILDLSMPALDGYEVVRRLRAQDECAGVRFIALTGRGGEAERARSLQCGFDEHLVKPVAPEALCSLLSRF